jgi:hypothetical protein
MPLRPGTRFKSTIYFGSKPFSFIAMTKSVPAGEKAAARAVVLEQPARLLERRRLVEFEWFGAFHK